MSKTRVILADDHALFRAGLRTLLEESQNIEVVGEAGDGSETIELAVQLQPDVIFLDITMKEMNGIEAAKRLKNECPDTKIIILSMHAAEEYVMRALKAGVAGYLLKDSVPSELENALRAIANGEIFLSPRVSKYVISGFLSQRDSRQSHESFAEETPFDRLSPRQREILQMVAEGVTTRDIATKLELSTKTVEAHRAEIMKRLDIHDLAGLVRYAIRIGLVSPDS